MSGVGFTPDGAKRIARAVRKVERSTEGNSGTSQRSHPLEGEIIMLLADGDCSAATNPFDGATYVEGTVIVPSAVSAVWSTTSYTPQELSLSTRKEWIVNRSVDAEFVENTFVIARRTYGEWLLIWHDCGPTERP